MQADPQVWFQLTFLLVVSVLSHFVISRMRQPMVFGEILVGVVIGPSIIGFALINIDLVAAFAQLGAIVLLFMIGLDSDVKRIYTRMNTTIALAGVAVPWVVGFLVVAIMQPGQGIGNAIFIGATLVATSAAITASLLKEMGIINTPVGSAIMGASVVDDIPSMVVLAIAGGAAVGSIQTTNIAYSVMAAVAFISVGMWGGRRYLCKVVEIADREGRERGLAHTGFVLAFTLAIFYAYIAEIIGISAIVGAFIAGAVFSDLKIKKDFQIGTDYLNAIFTPVFFVSLGILFNISGLSQYFWLAVVLTAVAILSKIVGCGLPAYFHGFSPRDSLRVGVGMVPRLEVALIIALYGLSTGIITEGIYSVVLFMGLVTTLVTPFLLRALFRERRNPSPPTPDTR